MDPLNSLQLAGAGAWPGGQNVAAVPGPISSKDLQSLLAAAEGGAAQPADPNARVGDALPTIPISQPAQIGAVPPTFDRMLGQFVNEVNAKQEIAGHAVTGLLSGQNVSLHQAMIAMEEASVSFQLMVEVRNKLLDSYQELMRMQI